MSARLGLLRQRTLATAHIGRVRAHNARGRASKLIYWHPAGGTDCAWVCEPRWPIARLSPFALIL